MLQSPLPPSSSPSGGRGDHVPEISEYALQTSLSTPCGSG